jgi:DNA polymerase-3 subunit epsilon
MKISLEASAVHGITDEMVADKPPFREVAQMLWEVFNGCYFAGFNIKNFDLPVLRREFVRVGMDFDYKSDMVIDMREIFRYMAPRTLSSAYEYYCGKELEVGHTAPLNAEVASEIFLSQLVKYKEVRDIEFLKGISRREEDEYLDTARKFYWKRGQAYFGFSKYKDLALSQVARLDPKFLEWILAADFSDETKKIVSAALETKKII